MGFGSLRAVSSLCWSMEIDRPSIYSSENRYLNLNLNGIECRKREEEEAEKSPLCPPVGWRTNTCSPFEYYYFSLIIIISMAAEPPRWLVNKP